MSVQFLEAWACQRHDLGEPVFGDGVLSMIVVPRRFTPVSAFHRRKRYKHMLGGLKDMILGNHFSS